MPRGHRQAFFACLTAAGPLRATLPTPESLLMRRIFPCLCVLVLSAGCSTTEPLGLRYGPHREVAEQRQDAQMIDPYPLPSVGPDISGARPRNFDVPRAQPVRPPTEKRWSILGY